MNTKFFHLKNGTKFLIATIFTGTVLTYITSYTIMSELQNKSDRIYADSMQIATNAIASSVAESEKIPQKSLTELFSTRFSQLISKNDDIAYIEYKDSNNNVIYSSKSDFPIEENETILRVNAPVNNGGMTGSVTVGMRGIAAKSAANSATKDLTLAFCIIWGIFTLLLLINYIALSKELQKLYNGVKQIATGKFGYKLESENMGELTDAFNDMSNILSKYEEQNIEQMTLERNKLEAVLMSIINGVIVCDNFDNVVMANSAALKMLDTDNSRFLNTKIQDYIDSHGQKCFLTKIEEFKDTPLNIIEQKPIEFNIEAGKLTIKAMISPMFSKQQDYVGYIIVLLDITRETEVNKLKNTFISNVSHELRTPVTVLRTYIDTLCNNGDDFDEETKKEFMKTIDIEAKRLHTMVNDILDFSRLESGKVNVRKEYANITDLIQQNINSIKILADEKNIKINFNIIDKLPDIPINIESIDRVIRNLLSNAIKYSEEGKDITVSEKISEDGQFAEIAFKDNGIGIAKEHLEKIFDRFYRVENATHTIKGTGLGLHLVKMTVEKYHHGKITVTSKEGEGSVFTVFLPLKADESELE